jgi:glutathione S-transferase
MARAKLYVVNGSHPCAAVQRALELKGIDYRIVEYPPPMHAPIMRMTFGERTVPGIKIDGEKLSGSRRIMRRLEELAPEPALFPADADARARVEEAERWGDEVFQSIGRRVIWPAMQRNPKAAPSYTAGSKIPLPGFMVRASMPVIARAERRLNKASEEALRADLQALPGHADRIDAWIADGTMGGEQPNAADLQIATTVALLMTVGDVRPIFAGRPSGELAQRLFGSTITGDMPAGVLPAEWLPATA